MVALLFITVIGKLKKHKCIHTINIHTFIFESNNNLWKNYIVFTVNSVKSIHKNVCDVY